MKQVIRAWHLWMGLISAIYQRLPSQQHFWIKFLAFWYFKIVTKCQKTNFIGINLKHKVSTSCCLLFKVVIKFEWEEDAKEKETTHLTVILNTDVRYFLVRILWWSRIIQTCLSSYFIELLEHAKIYVLHVGLLNVKNT